MNAIEAVGRFSQDELWRFSAGLVAMLVAIVVLSLLATLLTRVMFDLVVRGLANRLGFGRWMDSMSGHARAFIRARVGAKDPAWLPRHLSDLHPQRLSAQVANRLHAAAEADLEGVMTFLDGVDGLRATGRPDVERPRAAARGRPPLAAAPSDDDFAYEAARRRVVAARIDSAVDALQVRVMHQSMLAGYAVALASSLAISISLYAALRIPFEARYLIYGLLVAMFAGFVAALLHARFDRPGAS